MLDDLSLSVLPTEDIIKKFCNDLVKQQVLKCLLYLYNNTYIYILKAQSKDQLGVLHISHIYDSTKKALVVEVLFAEHIPGLDRSGELINLV